MKNINVKKLLPHVAAIGIFLVVNILYFNPAFTGKVIQQGDLTSVKGMRKEVVDFRERTGEEALWTNSMFSGMPAYHISTKHKGNLFTNVHRIISFALPNPAFFVFLYMIGFYILMIILRVNPWLSIIGALAFSFSSYLFQIIEAGHTSKAHAIAYMAPLLGCLILIFRKKYLLGGILFAFFFTMELRANHIQITYYLGMIFLIYLVIKFYQNLKSKEIPHFMKSIGIMVGSVLLAVLINIGNIWSTYEYGKVTMRGKSELTIDDKNKQDGLDPEYITNWSYGIGESWNLLIPNFKGGSSSVPIGDDDAAMKEVDPQYKQVVANIPQYFGDMPFTSGPYYIGAVALILFLLSMFYLKGTLKWVALIGICLALPLSWGKNMMWLTDFFIDYVPLYSKFRTVPMIQVIIELMVPLIAFYGLDRLINKNPELLQNNRKKLLTILAVPTGLLLLFYVSPTSFNTFMSDTEYKRISEQLTQAKWPQANVTQLFDNIESARVEIFKSDVMRSLLFIVATGVVLLLFTMKKLSNIYVMVSVAALILFDQWSVNRRYLNDDNFVAKRKSEVPFQKSTADAQILADTDPNYRVLNLAVNTFNDASTSYYHKSVGGYHAAKLMRYQELIDFHISKQNMKVLNMLNTRYVIVPTKESGPMAQKNSDALGNAWFVSDYEIVENADAEIEALNDFDPASQVVIDKRYKDYVSGLSEHNEVNGTINLTSYEPNDLKYECDVNKDAFAVFSEIYYEDGWNAYIDGEKVNHIRVNYVLRGLVIPAGKHNIEFKFEPAFYSYSNTISATFSILLILSLISLLYFELRKEKETVENE